MRYTVVLVPDERNGGYVAYVPVIPGCVTQGETVEEALSMAHDAAAGLLAIMAENGEGEPVESDGSLVTSIDVVRPELVTAGATYDAERATA